MKAIILYRLSILVSLIGLLCGWYWDPWHRRLPSPGMTLFLAIAGFFMVSVMIFSASVIAVLLRARKAKDMEEYEATVRPVMEGRKLDERMEAWTLIPRAIVSGVSHGAIAAVIIQYLVKW